MSIEKWNNPEQQSVDPSIKQEQIDREFDAVLKEFMNMDKKEQWEFIESLANKDPYFNELYTQLKSFFQERVMNLEDYDSHLKLEAVKKHIEWTNLDYSKNESIALEPNIDDLEALKAIFYRTAPDWELHSRYFTISNSENKRIATIKTEFNNWIERSRNHIDNKYPAIEENKNENEINNESEVLTETELLNSKGENNKKINESPEKQSEITILSLEEAQNYINNWKIELEKKEWELNEKILQMALISDIAGMYKEYLGSILDSIKFKAFSFKDEKYEVQIDLIETEIKEVSNIIGYLKLVWNSDDILEINAKELTKKLIISENKILNSSFFTSEYLEFWSFLDSWINTINEAISKPNLKVEDIKWIRLDIFEKMRKIDLTDTEQYQYNSWEAIRNRLTWNILGNEDLNSNEFIKWSFDLIKNISEEDKERLYSELNNGKESFFKFCESINLFDTLWIEWENFKKILLSRIFKALSDWMESLDTPKLEIFIKNEAWNRIDYLEKQLKTSENKEEIQKEIKRLKNNIEWKELGKQIEEIKVETAFKSFEKFIINHTLIRETKAVEKISKNNRDVALYTNIEGIWFGLSDKNSNSVVSFTQTLAEQIALMAVSWLIWNVTLKAYWAWETINLLNWWKNLANIWNIWRNLVVEWGAFYLGYTSLNSIIHKNEWTELLDDFNFYDAFRTIAFLWVLRSFWKTWETLNAKNISIDTAKLLWTDLIIRWGLWAFTWEEWLKGIDFENITDSNKEEIAIFIAEEIAFIIPLIVWLRLSEKITSTNVWEKVEVELTQWQFNIKFWDLKVEVKELDRLRKIAKKKGQNTDKIDPILKEKNWEYKALRDNNPEFTKGYYKEKDTKKDEITIENKPLQNQNETNSKPDKWTKSNADEWVNMNTWTPPRYLKAEKISKEVHEKWIRHTLKDEKLYETIEKTWIWKDWKWVWEAILRKAWFRESEIKNYKKWELKWSNKVESRILNEMKDVWKKISDDLSEIISLKIWGLSYKEILPKISNDVQIKLEKEVNRVIFWNTGQRNKKE